MLKLTEILNDPAFNVFYLKEEDAKIALIKLVGLYGGFSKNSESQILSDEEASQKLNQEFASPDDFNQKILQKIYLKLRPAREDGGLVERKDMANPTDVIGNLTKVDLVEILEKLGVFQEKNPPEDLGERQVRFIINGATQFGCQERINYVKNFLNIKNPPLENVIIDLATGARNLWPDGIGEGENSYKPDEMLTELLSERTGKKPEEIKEIISEARSQVLAEMLPDVGNPTLDELDAKQKAELRGKLTEKLKTQFQIENPQFAWPQESEMMLKLAQREFEEFGVTADRINVHGGVADPNQKRATGVTGLKKVSFDLFASKAQEADLIVVAGGGHAARFSSILSDELNALRCQENFNLYPAGSAFDKQVFSKENNGSSQNLLNLMEANLGVVNFQIEREKSKQQEEQKPSASPADQSSGVKLLEKDGYYNKSRGVSG